MLQVRELLETKTADMTGATIETKMKSIEGTARSMGAGSGGLING